MTNQVNNQGLIPSTDVIQHTLTLKMTTTQFVKTSITLNNNSPIQDCIYPDDHTQPTYGMTPGFKPFTMLAILLLLFSSSLLLLLLTLLLSLSYYYCYYYYYYYYYCYYSWGPTILYAYICIICKCSCVHVLDID